MKVAKEIKRIEIDVCLPAHVDGYLGDTNVLSKIACKVLNNRQKELKEKGRPYLYYEPVLKEIVE